MFADHLASSSSRYVSVCVYQCDFRHENVSVKPWAAGPEASTQFVTNSIFNQRIFVTLTSAAGAVCRPFHSLSRSSQQQNQQLSAVAPWETHQLQQQQQHKLAATEPSTAHVP